jgi:hypothetical protein
MGDIRDQLQGLTGADVLASQLSAAGGKAFISTNAKATQQDLNDVVHFWRSVHAPSYGLPIPSSSKTATGNMTTPTVLTPGANESAYVVGYSITNGSGTDAADITVNIGGATVFQGNAAPNATLVIVGFQGLQPFFLVGGQALTATQTGGSAADLSFAVAYSLSVQG